MYKKRPASQSATLEKRRENFKGLFVSKQIHVLKEILNLFKCLSATADLQLLGAGKNVGKVTWNTNISNVKQCILINQSPTGIFEQEVDLMKL